MAIVDERWGGGASPRPKWGLAAFVETNKPQKNMGQTCSPSPLHKT